MRVELCIDKQLPEPFAVLHIQALTPTIQAALEILQKEGQSALFTVQDDTKFIILAPSNIVVVRTEGRDVIVYDKKKRKYKTSKTLNEVQEALGNNFMRISKSTIVNLLEINHVEASFNATMEITMNNGVEDIITRSFYKQFKNRLGV